MLNRKNKKSLKKWIEALNADYLQYIDLCNSQNMNETWSRISQVLEKAVHFVEDKFNVKLRWKIERRTWEVVKL